MDIIHKKKHSTSDDQPRTQETELLNCWEVLGCGREPGGDRADIDGVCLAALAEEHDGVNGGINGGRRCWRIVGTIYEGSMEGDACNKLAHCAHCRFFSRVLNEMGEDYAI